MPASFILCLWIVSAGLSLLVRAQTRVIGASLPVLASVGDEVVLPCRCDPPLDLRPLTVEWSRTELKPDPSDPYKKVPFVHVYTERHEDMDMKIPEFVNRTQLFPEHFVEGNASLRIRRVALSDNGTYKCFIPNLRKDAFATLIVHPAEELFLTETEDTEPKLNDNSPDPLPLRSRLAIVISLVLVFNAIVVFIIIKKRICKLQKPDVECQSENPDQREGRTERQVSEEGQKLITECPTDDTKSKTRQGG